MSKVRDIGKKMEEVLKAAQKVNRRILKLHDQKYQLQQVYLKLEQILKEQEKANALCTAGRESAPTDGGLATGEAGTEVLPNLQQDNGRVEEGAPVVDSSQPV